MGLELLHSQSLGSTYYGPGAWWKIIGSGREAAIPPMQAYGLPLFRGSPPSERKRATPDRVESAKPQLCGRSDLLTSAQDAGTMHRYQHSPGKRRIQETPMFWQNRRYAEPVLWGKVQWVYRGFSCRYVPRLSVAIRSKWLLCVISLR